MNYYKNIDEIVTDDEKWRKMAMVICGDKMQADDYVNNFYMKYMQMSKTPDAINAGYIHTSIVRFHNEHKSNTIKKREYDENVYSDEMDQDFYNYNAIKDIDNHILHANIMKELADLEWFHSKLFALVVVDGNSMREIERQTGISFNTIQSSIATTKKYLKNKYK